MGAFLLTRELKDETKKSERLARIEELESEISEKAAGVVNAMLAAVEIDPKQADPPPAWVEEFGEEGARLRLKVAQAAWFPAATTPAFFKLAIQVQVGLARGRQYRMKITQNNLNVKLTLPAPTSAAHPGPVTYEVRDLET